MKGGNGKENKTVSVLLKKKRHLEVWTQDWLVCI